MIACAHWTVTYAVPVVAGIIIAFLLVQNRRLWLRAYCAEQSHTRAEFEDMAESQGLDLD